MSGDDFYKRQQQITQFLNHATNRYTGDLILNKVYKIPTKTLNPDLEERSLEIQEMLDEKDSKRYKKVPTIGFIQEQPQIINDKTYEIFRKAISKERLGINGSTVFLQNHISPFPEEYKIPILKIPNLPLETPIVIEEIINKPSEVIEDPKDKLKKDKNGSYFNLGILLVIILTSLYFLNRWLKKN